MRIHTRIEIALDGLLCGKTTHEEGFDYSGPVAECKGGGGGGSGGKVDYPDYVRTAHNQWLDGTGADTMTSSVVDLMNTAMGANPFTSAAAYSPNTPLTAIGVMDGLLDDVATAALPLTNWTAAFTQAETDYDTAVDALVTLVAAVLVAPSFATPAALAGYAYIAPTYSAPSFVDPALAGLLAADDVILGADADAFAAVLDDQIDAVVLPKFQRGMQNINAVQSSAFVIGEAVIVAMRDRDVARYLAETRRAMLVQKYTIESEHTKTKNLVNAEYTKLQNTENANHTTLKNTLNAENVKHSNDVVAAHTALQNTVNAEYRKLANSVLAEHAKLDNVARIELYKQRGQLLVQAANTIVQFLVQATDIYMKRGQLGIEGYRYQIAALKEQTDKDLEIDEADARWDLEMYAYGGNLLAAPSGGVIQPSPQGKSMAASALGGAMSGAAAGAMAGTMIMPGIGTGIGAAAGGLLGAASSLL